MNALDGLYLQHVAELGRRYDEVLEACGWDAVAIHAGRPKKRTTFDDQYWPLRPTPHYQHWVPLAEADGVVVVRSGRKPALVRVKASSFWEDVHPPETRAFLDAFDVVEVESADVGAYIPKGRTAFVGEEASVAEAWGLSPRAACPAALVDRLDALRVEKTAYEVACLDEANARARVGHEALRGAFREGSASELDLHLLYLRTTSQDDAETPYKNIVALGAHAATLHHVAYGRGAARGVESLLVDAGATCRGYGADVTRTWVKGGGDTADAFRQLVAGVDGAQQRVFARARVGQSFEALHDASHVEIAGVLRDAGIVTSSVDEAVATGVTRAFFPHGLGHALGLQTHDVGCGLRLPRPENRFLRHTTSVGRGQVFTIEPGVYFIDALLAPLRAGPHRAGVDWRRVDALAPLGGVRIEDDVHVPLDEASALRNLTRRHLPEGGGAA